MATAANPPPVLITGANGQLGWELCRQAHRFGFLPRPLDHQHLDIADAQAVDAAVTNDLSLVINAAAFTAVDRAEQASQAAMAVNADGPGHLARACARTKLPLIHISTDYVFDGTARNPYRPADPVVPLGVYGHSKAAGEQQVRKHLDTHLIIRTAWVYGVHGANFVKTMLRVGHQRSEVRVVNDQVGSPTFAADLAAAVLTAGRRCCNEPSPAWGTYHFCNAGQVSWYGFARRIFELAKQWGDDAVPDVVPISSDQYPSPVTRPAFSVLDSSALVQAFGVPCRSWQAALEEMLNRYRVEENLEE